MSLSSIQQRTAGTSSSHHSDGFASKTISQVSNDNRNVSPELPITETRLIDCVRKGSESRTVEEKQQKLASMHVNKLLGF
jgi:hypothetical protein